MRREKSRLQEYSEAYKRLREKGMLSQRQLEHLERERVIDSYPPAGGAGDYLGDPASGEHGLARTSKKGAGGGGGGE